MMFHLDKADLYAQSLGNIIIYDWTGKWVTFSLLKNPKNSYTRESYWERVEKVLTDWRWWAGHVETRSRWSWQMQDSERILFHSSTSTASSLKESRIFIKSESTFPSYQTLLIISRSVSLVRSFPASSLVERGEEEKGGRGGCPFPNFPPPPHPSLCCHSAVINPNLFGTVSKLWRMPNLQF